MPPADDTRVSRDAVTRLRLQRQGLLPARAGSEPDAVSVLNSLGQVQLDPMNVVSRSEHLTIRSRAPRYRPTDLAGLYAPESQVFECWTRASSILSMDLYPLVAPAMQVGRTDAWWPRWVASWLADHPDLAEDIMRQIEHQGPMASRDFPKDPGRQSGWGGAKKPKEGLMALWAAGRLMVAERRGGEPAYDLTERVLPENVEMLDISDDERVMRLLHAGLRSYGACELPELAALWGPVGWPSDRKLTAKEIRERADAYGLQLFRVGDGKWEWACLPEDVDALVSGEAPDPAPEVSILCPFDNLLWNRRLLAELFDFDYRLEAYLPPAKRKFGPYTMPILWGRSFVGRLDPKLDRKRGVLVINGIWLEDQGAAPADLVTALGRELTSLSEFLGAVDMDIKKTKPASLKAALRRSWGG